MRRWLLGTLLALSVAVCAIVASYVLLDNFYGTMQREVYVQSGGQQLGRVVPQTLEDVEQSNPAVLTYEDNEITAHADLIGDWSDTSWYQNVKTRSWENVIEYDLVILNSAGAQMEPIFATQYDNLSRSSYILALSPPPATDAEDGAPAAAPSAGWGGTEEAENAAGISFFVYETKPINVLPIAAGIGIAMSVVVFAVWIGYRQIWGEATSTLLEQGLHDMTVKDVEMVGQIMEMKEFTIPELMKLTKTSKITVWRTVQKLVKRGLVQPTEQTKLAANGLGGRGKPSRVYKYVGKRELR